MNKTDSLLQELMVEVEGMKKEYIWSDDGFDSDVPYGKHLSECKRHYSMAIKDVLSLIKSKRRGE